VIDHWWQTETGWPIAADLMGLEPMPTKPGSPTVPVPGYDLHVDPGHRRRSPAAHDRGDRAAAAAAAAAGTQPLLCSFCASYRPGVG
jgi:acyl-coenzyme A synthetase/AMP-(fatty) acid ligase